MSSVVKSTNGVTYTPSLVTLEDGEDINSVHLQDTDILSGQSIQQIITSDITKSGVGQVDPDSDGTGEIFNCYTGTEKSLAPGKYSHCEGSNSLAQGQCSHAEGYNVGALGDFSHGEGMNNIANGDFSHVEGYNNHSDGEYSHCEGCFNDATGESSHAEGWSVEASGLHSHAEGGGTKSTGSISHAEGFMTISSGQYSHSEGEACESKGQSSHTEGHGTIANNECEHAQGQYNISNTGDSDEKNTIHSIGIGEYQHNKNAQEVMVNGDYYIIGVGNYDGTNYSEAQTVQQVINNLSQSEQSLNLFEVQNIKDSLGEITILSGSAQTDYDYIDFVFTGSGTYDFLAYRSSNNAYYRAWLEKKDTFNLNVWNSSDYYQVSINMLLMCKNDGQLYYFVYSRGVSAQAPFRGYTPVYTLPTASSDTLGGIKIGNGLSIDDDGIVSITNDYITQSYADGKYATLTQIGDIETILDNIIGG